MFPKTILAIILKDENTIDRLLVILGYLISYMCQFDFLLHSIKGSRKYFPRISLYSLKNLHFNTNLFNHEIEKLVENLLDVDKNNDNEGLYDEYFVALQTRIFDLWNVPKITAENIMNYLHIDIKLKNKIINHLGNAKN